jgi:hypothetical protein
LIAITNIIIHGGGIEDELSRAQVGKLSMKSPPVNILVLASPLVTVKTVKFCHHSTKAAMDSTSNEQA